MRKLLLFGAPPLALAAGLFIVALIFAQRDPVTPAAASLMDSVVEALVADDADALYALLDASQQLPPIRPAIDHLLDETPDGAVVEFTRTDAAAADEDGERRIQVTRRYRFEGGRVWIVFDMVEDDAGARLLGLAVLHVEPGRL